MRSWLAPGEQVIVQSRPQARSLTLPVAVFLVIPAVAGFALAWLSRGSVGRLAPALVGWQTALMTAVVVLASLAWIVYPLRRYLRWAGTRYTLTSRRIVVRRGWLRRSRQDIPLATVRNLGSRQSGLQRILRSGTIALDLGQGESALMADMPEVARFRNFALAAIDELPHSSLARPENDWNFADDGDGHGEEDPDNERR
ncbi:PH domain-containing protein [Paenarthrobacter sp. Z7-10]|uniref:PH domain-containing protein n=1 Tax=Paenarthrobacter sp. Z7-10 TaxID=2787635 RepID=UPI0022A9AB85|nr:PH domain-containing protein [Paenarthrobacter sp. Z7-10]MCZ2402903.1 PH domain-containing protein [Paenarthrobacter sp. Z7-10]